jgi:hypothetical protein
MAVADGDEADGSGHGASSRAFRNDDGGVANSSGSWIDPSTTSSKREFFLAGCWTGDGAENITVDDGDALENGVGDADSVDVADGRAKGDGDRVGDGVGVRTVVGIGVGVRSGDGVGDADNVGDGKGRSTTGASVGCVSAVLVDFSFAARAGVRIDPGSDQSPIFSPLTKVVCKRVCPCSLMTGPSNFPWTILPV